MTSWLQQLDALLRGERGGDAVATDVPVSRLVMMVLLLGAIYGCFMGWYAVARHWMTGSADGWLQLTASTLKLPLLFLVTIGVTFPSLYVFSALAGLRLDFMQTLRVILGALVVMLTVAASLGPILGFFTLSTTSYPFMVVLNVVLLSIAGFIGLGFMRKVLERFGSDTPAVPVIVPDQDSSATPGAPKPAPVRAGHTILTVWLTLFALVGVQTGWLLRPFIGHPAAEFTLFRVREGNFFLGLLQNIGRMFGS